MNKYIYCKDCWNKLVKIKCTGCFAEKMGLTKGRPYFCGNCNTHVSGISARRLDPVIKLLKKQKIDPPFEIASYGWD